MKAASSPKSPLNLERNGMPLDLFQSLIHPTTTNAISCWQNRYILR